MIQSVWLHVMHTPSMWCAFIKSEFLWWLQVVKYILYFIDYTMCCEGWYTSYAQQTVGWHSHSSTFVYERAPIYVFCTHVSLPGVFRGPQAMTNSGWVQLLYFGYIMMEVLISTAVRLTSWSKSEAKLQLHCVFHCFSAFKPTWVPDAISHKTGGCSFN